MLETETPLLKGAHKISHTPRSSAETVTFKNPGSDPFADLGEASQREDYWVFPWGHRGWQQPFYGSLFYHEDTGARKHHFGVLL